jgi:hypothetical protein
MLALTACGAPSLTGGGTAAPASGSSGSAAGACTNPWQPVVAGASWSYQESGPKSGSYVRTIQTVSADGFTEQDAFSSGITHSTNWKCDHGALTADDPFSADVSSGSSAINLQTTSIEGTGMPATTQPGDSFSITYHMAGTITENGKTAPVKEDVAESCTADGMKSVTVPAGTFDALHLTCKLNLTINMTIQGASAPVVSASTAERFYAKNVGLVKSTDQSSAGLRVVELTAYKIP